MDWKIPDVLSPNSIWDIIFMFITLIGCVNHVKRKIHLYFCKEGNLHTFSAVIKDGEFQSNHKLGISKPCEDERNTKMVISSYERTPVRPNTVITGYRSNLRTTNFYEDKINDQLNVTKPPRNTEDCGTQKRKCLDVLSTELLSPADNNITVYPVRQHEHTNSTSTDRESADIIDGIDDNENDEADEDFRGTDSASTDNVSYAVNTSDVENQQLTEGSDSRQENLNQDEVNLPEQRSAHCTSESVGIVTGTQSRHPEFEMFAARLQTYLGCPQSLQGKAHDLATAGFFYTGVKDHTICFFCGRVLKDWETEDEPWIEHARWFPDCSFVIKNQQQKLADYDLDSLRQRQHSQQQSSPNKLQQPNRPVQPTDNCVSKSNCSSSDHIHQPMYPQFANLALRRNTFQEAVFLNDQQMAEAGFFYKEPGLLICFHCGGHLFTWKPGVNLWNEHARLFPNCTYLNAHRDQNFIMDVIKRFEETETLETVPSTYSQTPQRSSKLTHRRNNLETSNPQSPTASGHTDDKGNRFDTSSKMDQDKRAKEALLKHMNTQQNPTPSPRQDQNLPIPFGTQTQENLQVRLSQSVLVENAQEQMLRPAVISNRNTSQIAQNRTVYSSRVTIHTHTGQVIERYPWNLICKLCQEHLADVAFFPCGHTVCCRRCSRNASVCCECHRAIQRTENV